MSYDAHHRRMAVSFITKTLLAAARAGLPSTSVFALGRHYESLDDALLLYEDDTHGFPRDRHGRRVARSGVRLHPDKLDSRGRRDPRDEE